MPPKKKVVAAAAQPRKTADKVKPETMTDEAWAEELVRYQYVTEDRNWYLRDINVYSLSKNIIIPNSVLPCVTLRLLSIIITTWICYHRW
jgi:hypothetical protein